MARERYQSFNFKQDTLDLIETMDNIVHDYQNQGFTLTVRQLYYQLVARNIVPNTERSYKRVTSVANDARLAGMIDWSAIEDRTRAFVRRQRWRDAAEILRSAADSFHIDMWYRQRNRVFVIIEKEALVGVLEPTCFKYDTPILAARGYPSSTVIREFVQTDILPVLEDGRQNITILHLGDHDPSGLDMTRDLRDRFELFSGCPIELVRLGLNMDQIEERQPPPNPAKTPDSRFQNYMEQYGSESWELDALPPAFLAELVEKEIRQRIDFEHWELSQAHVENVQSRIRTVAKKFV